MKRVTKRPRDKRVFAIRLISIVLTVLMVSGLLTSALLTMASAASSSQLRKELDALKGQAQEIAAQGAELEKELATNATRTQSTIERKVAIDMRISVTEAEVQNANQQIQQYGLLIAQKQSELEDAMVRQAEMNDKYEARLRAMEENGKVSYWSILFKARSFSDLLSRIDSIREVAQADQVMLRQLQELASEIETDRQELEQELAAQEETKRALAEMEVTLQQQRAEADALLLELEGAYRELSDEYLAYEEREAELRQQIIDAQVKYEAALSAEEEARLAEQNKNNVAGGGGGGGNAGGGSSGGGASSGFSAPLSYLNVTCAYGWRIHPIWGDRRFHSGVDLAANQGTPIYAIASGTVTSASYSDANGYNVSISHGGGYGSMYAHMTHYTVSAGQSVSQGEVIGYVGSTGWSTGPHLHFELYVNGSTVNPMDYIG